jgi:hypothetical protein
MINNNAPEPNELEISLFGNGYGECIVIHLGAGEWVVVDSFINCESGQPIALDYLDSLRLDPAVAVKHLVVTHWHDDHMAGTGDILNRCPQASFICSAALQSRQFFTLIEANRQLMARNTTASGTSEFAAILDTLGQRRQAGARVASPEWASKNQMMFSRPGAAHIPPAAVEVLAPSSATVTAGLLGIGSQLAQVGRPKRATVSIEPNDTAVVLYVQVGNIIAILGADLEVGRDPSRGWLEIVTSAQSGQRSKASIYKVAHHGSPNADHPAIWTTALTAEPIALVTPFFRGSVSLPSKTDVQRLKTQASQLWTASTVTKPAPTHNRPSAVERTIREVARSMRPREGKLGQVRLRNSDAGIRIDTFGAAVQL